LARRLKNPVLHLISIVIALVIVIPVTFGVLGGFKDNGQLTTNPVGLPRPWVFSHYLSILTSGIYWLPFAISLFIALITVLIVIGVSALAAYVFARFAFRAREVLFTLFAMGLMFPFQVAILPVFIMVRNLGLLNNPLGVILPQAAFGLPVTIIILRSFFRT